MPQPSFSDLLSVFKYFAIGKPAARAEGARP
jgi:hypothetical protein